MGYNAQEGHRLPEWRNFRALPFSPRQHDSDPHGFLNGRQGSLLSKNSALCGGSRRLATGPPAPLLAPPFFSPDLKDSAPCRRKFARIIQETYAEDSVAAGARHRPLQTPGWGCFWSRCIKRGSLRVDFRRHDQSGPALCWQGADPGMLLHRVLQPGLMALPPGHEPSLGRTRILQQRSIRNAADRFVTQFDSQTL